MKLQAEGSEAMCVGDSRTTTTVNNGNDHPSFGSEFSEAQRQAIGSLSLKAGALCSGSLITTRWVLTAKHCTDGTDKVPSGASFTTGPSGSASAHRFTITAVVPHPDEKNDLVLAQLAQDVSSQLPNVQPLGLIKTVLNSSMVLKINLEAAGFGQGSGGDRKFVSLRFWDITDQHVVVWGEGNRGVCYGDSGGPLLHTDGDGSIRIAGVLHQGLLPKDVDDCTGIDAFSRVDASARFKTRSSLEWISQTVCGGSDKTGSCLGVSRSCRASNETPQSNSASYRSPIQLYGDCPTRGVVASCKNGERQETRCSSGQVCGWNTNENRYGCIDPQNDPCNGTTLRGACDGNVARWCQFDWEEKKPVAKSKNCNSCNQVCALVQESGGVDCRSDDCQGVSASGRCTGEVAEWCDGGRMTRVNCASFQESCEANSLGEYRCKPKDNLWDTP